MESIFERIKADGVKFIELEFTDIFGTLKSIEIPVECLDQALERGIWFDGSSIRGFARIMESDMYLMPDPGTYALLAVDDDSLKTARFMCDVYTPQGDIFEGDPRAVLKRIMGEARDMGYVFMVGPEVEFYLFRKDENGSISTPEFDTGSYFDSSAKDIGSDIRKEIMAALKAFGIDSERAHHEVGVGQHEVGFKFGDALVTADKVIILKKIIKSIAHKYGLIASFMPKPLFAKAGNGMHCHCSIFNTNGDSVFYHADDEHKLSPLAKSFIAGLLQHIKEMAAITNPTVNSYKRLVSGYEAPVYICWGSKNRSSLVRIPHFTKGRESSVRAELRCPDPSASPYLLFASILKAGLYGMQNNLELAPEVEDSMYTITGSELTKLGIDILPQSLEEAVDYFRSSTLMKELLGEDLFNKYADAKENEAREFKAAVTDWEIDRYIDKC
ncbi:MAG: type I glutamate--ammonia ligase [Candidatus Krumholzibacteriota bacterium]|nr:type I glutamate--ammonia ligase [Candidatus Krumholzibacteriota bacterium]